VTQIELLAEPADALERAVRFELGRGYALHLPRGARALGTLYHRGTPIKQVNLRDKAERRLLAVELMQKGVNQSRLAEALQLSRQTLHNYRESYREFGVQGLLHGYSPAKSKDEELHRHLNVNKRRPGSKARELEAMRRAKREQSDGEAQAELDWDGQATYELQEPAIEETLSAALAGAKAIPPQSAPSEVVASERPYAENHDWEASRYAGIFPILMVLISQWHWLSALMRLFGNGWKLFMVFALMGVSNIRSIEQLKHVRRDEAGRLLGIGSLPCLETLWGWFHDVAKHGRAAALLAAFSDDQLQRGLVGTEVWFTDGHLLPYTGLHKVHASYHTQRRMPTPGQTNLVTCDARGRVVCFEIQEGKGDLRGRILALGEYARAQGLGVMPLQVFDREGDGLEFFSTLVATDTPFVTWEKNADVARLRALEAGSFTETLSLNGTEYRLLEEEKVCTDPLKPAPCDAESEPTPTFKLRRVVIWNLRTGHRTSVVCWGGTLGLSTVAIASAMLSRWGASENTFKHLQERHPYHYHPGFGVSESEKQDIANPAIKAIDAQRQALKTQLNRLYKQQTKCKPGIKKDGTLRANSKHQRIAAEIAAAEAELARLKAERDQLPERVDVSTLSDYRSFQAIDNDGKHLFDVVTSSVWNARCQLIDWLEPVYAKDSDRVDLLYAILNCHGWIRSDAGSVVVRLEPLQQPARRAAQEQLCRKLTGLGARIPGGKWLRIEVGDAPL
jgi:transposase